MVFVTKKYYNWYNDSEIRNSCEIIIDFNNVFKNDYSNNIKKLLKINNYYIISIKIYNITHS